MARIDGNTWTCHASGLLWPLVVVLLLNALPVRSLYAEDSAVIRLNAVSFQEKVMGDNAMWMVEFYAPWCGNCQKLAPQYEKAASSLKDYVKFAAIDADQPENKKLVQQFNVQGFPTILAFSAPATKNPYTGKMFREAIAYDGQHTSRSLQAFATKLMPSAVVRLKKENYYDFLAKKKQVGLPVVLLFTTKAKTSTMFKALSMEYKDRVAFAEVQDTEEGITEDFNVSTFPTLMVIKPDGDQETYDGTIAYSELNVFIGKFAPSGKTVDDIEESETEMETVTDQNFDGKVKKSKSGWVLAYNNKEGASPAIDCASVSWKKFSKDMKDLGLFETACVDCLESPQLCKDHGTKYVTVFPYGDKTTASAMTVKSLDKAKERLAETLPERLVHIASSEQLNQFVQAAVTMKHVPTVILTKQTDPSLLSRAIGVGLEERALVAYVPNPSADILSQFSTDQVPSILVLFPKERIEEDKQVEMQVLKLDKTTLGKFSYSKVVNIITELYQAHFAESEAQSEVTMDASSRGSVSVPYLTTETMETACKKNPLCVIFFFDKSQQEAEQDSTAQEVVLAKQIAEESQAANEPYTFVWIDGTCQSKFAQSFGLGPMNIPTMVVLSWKKRRYSTYVGTLSPESARSFLMGVLNGKLATSSFEDEPQLFDIDCEASRTLEETVPIDDDVDLEDLEDMLSEIINDEEKAKTDLERELEEERVRKEKVEAEKKHADTSKNSKKKKKKKRKKKSVKDEL